MPLNPDFEVRIGSEDKDIALTLSLHKRIDTLKEEEECHFTKI